MNVRKYLFIWFRSAGRSFRSISAVRAPLTVSICAALILSFPAQTREIYRVLAQDVSDGSYTQGLFAILLSALAAVTLWRIARTVSGPRGLATGRTSRIASAIARWAPRVCGVLIPLGMAAGLWMASFEVESLSDRTLERIPQLAHLSRQMASTASLLALASALQLALAVVLFALFCRTSQPDSIVATHNPTAFGTLSHSMLFILPLGALACVLAFPTAGPQLIGAIAIVLVFVIALAFITSNLTAYFDRHGIPVLTVIVLTAGLFSVFDWNDNHSIRLEKRAEVRYPKLKGSFADWLKSREDLDHYKAQGRP
jgi:hypothetical protein